MRNNGSSSREEEISEENSQSTSGSIEVSSTDSGNDTEQNIKAGPKTKGEIRVLVVGDLHFSERSLYVLDDLKRKIIETIKKTKPDTVVFLGDTLDRFASISSVRLTEATEFFYECSLLSPIVLLIGNHDIPNKKCFMSTHHGFNALRHYWKNTTVVDRQCVEFKVGEFVFQAVPYCPNGRLMDGLNTLPDRCETPKAIFCHQEIFGTDLGGIASETGDKWNCKGLLVCGHIHKHSYMRTESGEVLYVGSPYQDNHSECPDKSISMLTFTQDGWKEKRIYLGLPTKVKLVMTAREFKKWIPEKNTIYTVSVHDTSANNSKYRGSDKVTLIELMGGTVTFINTTNKADVISDNFIPKERKVLKTMIAESIKEKKHLHSTYSKVFV